MTDHKFVQEAVASVRIPGRELMFVDEVANDRYDLHRKFRFQPAIGDRYDTTPVAGNVQTT